MSIFLIGAILIAQPQDATLFDVPERIGFRITGVELSAPRPEGYCIPKVRLADVAQLVAAGDDDNFTHLTLVACEETRALDDYAMIKTPRQAMTVRIERDAFLKAMEAEFANPEMEARFKSDEFMAGSSKSMSEALGTKVSFAGDVGPRGQDSDCAYLGGIINVSATDAAQRYDVALGGCMTAVGGRVVTVYWYSRDATDAGVRDLMRRARGVAMSLEPMPSD